ncbi:hypothetical protein ABZ942_15605 [Nocardia sp. NPDC046473]|uniref:hypothetical protein n=1 Tax=Nocardia sp. NPDC046473 TaxID=3155733 RepID=UPI0033D2FE06
MNAQRTNPTWTGMVPVDDTAQATGGPGLPVLREDFLAVAHAVRETAEASDNDGRAAR